MLANVADASSTLAYKLPQKTQAVILEMSSGRMTFIVFTNALFFVGTAFTMLVAPKADKHGLGPILIQVIAMSAFHFLCVFLGLLLAIRLCVIQIQDTKARPRAKGISIISLVLQTVALIVLALLQVFRPNPPSLPSWRTEWYGLYLERWSISINYLIIVVGDIFALCIRLSYLYSW